MRILLTALTALSAALVLGGGSARADSILDRCTAETCKARLSADALLAEAQQLVLSERYDEAKPLLAALWSVPTYKFEARFLTGYVAEHTGDFGRAEAMFRAILNDDPKQVRVRLELGKTLLAMGKTAAGDHQLRLVAESDELPADIARTIRSVRSIIRSKRAWSLNVDLGIAPDSNINNATGADTVTVLFGTQPIPLTLDQSAQARSGVGVTGSIDANVRLPIAKNTQWLVDFDAFATQYKGSAYDDLSLEFATGPEFKLSEKVRLRGEAVVAQRDFGNRVVSRQIGGKSGLELTLDDKQRLALQLDIRNTDALFDPGYDGWNVAAYATYERVVGHAMIASASVFARRDQLRSAANADAEVGGLLGFGGELPKGFNFGVSAGASRAVYDEAQPFFSLDPRRDWRLNGRLTLGNRAVRVWGFSPTVSYSYSRNASSIAYYATDRSRVRFALARYF